MTQIIITGLDKFQRYFESQPEITEQAASMAINKVAGGTGLTLLKNEIYNEINFPMGYLNSDSRLSMSKKASPGDLSASIKARDRATSLASFASKGQTPRNTRGRGVRVQVAAKGSAKLLLDSWLVPLNNGNTGLAVRLKPGQRLNKHTPSKVKLAPDVFLLYGPSVDQALGGVADLKGPELALMMEKEFLRNVRRLNGE